MKNDSAVIPLQRWRSVHRTHCFILFLMLVRRQKACHEGEVFSRIELPGMGKCLVHQVQQSAAGGS